MMNLNKVPMIVGIVNNILMAASTLGVLGFLPIPYDARIFISSFTSKTFYPYYFNTKIAHIFSFAAIIILIVLLLQRKVNIVNFIVSFILNFIWMLYFWLLLKN